MMPAFSLAVAQPAATAAAAVERINLRRFISARLVAPIAFLERFFVLGHLLLGSERFLWFQFVFWIRFGRRRRRSCGRRFLGRVHGGIVAMARSIVSLHSQYLFCPREPFSLSAMLPYRFALCAL